MEEVGKILPRVLDRRAPKHESTLAELLIPLWKRVAGPAIAAESRPESFAGGTLTLSVSSASWAVTLKNMSEQLRAAVNGYMGNNAVRKLRIVVPAGIARGEADGPGVRSYVVRDETISRLEKTLARFPAFPKG